MRPRSPGITRLIEVFTLIMTATALSVCSAGAQPPPSFPEPVFPTHRILPLPVPWGTIAPEKLDLDVDARERVARISATQTFRNPTGTTLEGDFLFPLPPGVQVTDLVFEADGREMAGEIMDAEEARRHYESVVRRRRDPALLEYVGHNIFRARVFPIPPGATRSLTLSYTQVLPTDAGLVEFRYPLTGGRFVPAGSEPLEAAPRTNMPRHAWDMELRIDVDLEDDSEIGSIYSPSHEVNVERDGERRAHVDLSRRGAESEGDFLLYYVLDPGELGMSFFSYLPSDEDGYFLVLASPGADLPVAERGPLSMLFVLDTSGSMKEGKLDEARNALITALGNLGPEDRFGIITFSNTVETFRRELLPGTRDNLRDARLFLERLRANGGTNLAGALEDAFRILGASSSETTSRETTTQVFLLTDGLPTVGEKNVKRILERLGAMAGERDFVAPHVFSMGVGYDVNTHLLSRLAEDFQGSVECVTPEESVEGKVGRLLEKISSPLLSELDFQFPRLRTSEVYPPNIPFLFQGEQISIVGRMDANQATRIAVRLTAERPDGQRLRMERVFRLGADSPGGDFVARLWASRKVAYLLDEIRLHGENKELVDEVVEVAKRFGIVTQYTSYLADPQFLANRGGRSDEVSYLMGSIPTLREETGAGAVGRLRSLGYMEKSLHAAAPEVSVGPPPSSQHEAEEAGLAGPAPLRWIEGRTFYLRGDVWTDEGWNEDGHKLAIRPYGDAYQKLLREWPAAAHFLSLGERVRLMVGEVALEISPEGEDDLTADDWKALRRAWKS